MTFLLSLFRVLTAGKSIFDTIQNLYAARLKATTDQDRMAIDLQIATLQAQASVQQNNVWSDFQRSMFAFPFEVYFWKVIIWDKVLGYGTTEVLDPHLWYIAGIVVGFYFLNTTLGRWLPSK